MENDIKKAEEGKKRAGQMLEDYEALKSTLNVAQKILLDRYCVSYEKFMFGVCDTAYEAGYNDALEKTKKNEEI